MAKENIQKNNEDESDKEKFENLKKRFRKMIKDDPKRMNLKVRLRLKPKTH